MRALCVLAAGARAAAQCAADDLSCSRQVEPAIEPATAKKFVPPAQNLAPGKKKKKKRPMEEEDRDAGVYGHAAGIPGMPWIPRQQDDGSKEVTEQEKERARLAAEMRAVGGVPEAQCRAIADMHVAGGSDKCPACMPPLSEDMLATRLVNTSEMLFDLADAGQCYHGPKSSTHAYCLPSLQIIGAMKAGTTEMVTWLTKHPAIKSSRHELEYFSNDFLYKGDRLHSEIVQEYPMGVKTFKLSRDEVWAGRMVLETSPEYMYTRSVPMRVRDLMPSARFIAILRHPADRMYSQFQMDCWYEATASFRYITDQRGTRIHYFQRKRPDPSLPAWRNAWPSPEALKWPKAECNATDFDRWVDQLISDVKRERVKGVTRKRFFQAMASEYSGQLSRWNRLFPCQVFVVTSEMMYADMAGVANKVFNWLGLPEVDYAPLMEMNDRGFWVLKDEFSKSRVERKYPPILPATRDKLNTFFFSDTIANLKEQYPRLNISHW